MHVSISGRLRDSALRAREIGCVNTFQVFSCSPRRWNALPLKDEEVEAFRQNVAAGGFEVFCHMPYLPNLCSPDPKFFSASASVLTREIQRCEKLGIESLVVHFGSHMGTSVEDGHKRLVQACRKSIEETKSSRVRILLENSAGVRNSVGSNFAHVRSVLDSIEVPDRTGVCFDTCHAFASGYDLRTPGSVEATMKQFGEIIGEEKLLLIHMNDSKAGLGEAKDRHEDIGRGKIGSEGFRAMLALKAFSNVPVILETPLEEEGDDKRNLAVAKSLL